MRSKNEVKEKHHIKEFLEFPIQLYKDVKEWIRPLDNDVEEVLVETEPQDQENGDNN